ncbi:MAG: flavodoxin family protein [Eubacteriales bacterium]|nr:flavodoxin family protein [Eubacteriales bacterium]
MGKKLILCISSSPRKGANTDILLAHAAAAAEEYDFIRTETIYLRDYNISPCNSCVACCTEAAAKGNGDRACLSFRDDMDKLYPKLLECKGLILASPVYFGSVNAQMKAFMDRTEGLLRYGMSKYKDALSRKIGGGIVVGGNRNGGQEFTLQQIHYYFAIQDMTIVGSGREPIPGCYLGGAGVTYPERGRVRDAVLKDELGLKSTANLGRRVAETMGMMNL